MNGMKDELSQWLIRRTTVIDVENGFPSSPTRTWWQRLLWLAPSSELCGDWLKAWNKLKGSMCEGDELWEFCSPPET
jgi:hypothetical protein